MKNLLMFVMYDLPTETKADRKYAQHLRKDLLSLGFYSFQYSVMIRPVVASLWDKYANKVRLLGTSAPLGSRIDILRVTDNQFNTRDILAGTARDDLNPVKIEQLTII